jgi:6-phosphogluconolactonase
MISNGKNMISVFRTIEALNESAAQLFVHLAEKSVMARGRFLLCLSGGNTPKGLYNLLSVNPYRDIIPWKNTFIFWSDERCVPADDERNNARMATEVLLKKIDIPSSNIFPVLVNLNPAEAASNYEQTLRDFFGMKPPRFDLILLGLGENGHTASLFSGTEVLREKSHWVKEVFVEELKMFRITMTAMLINKARHILFLVKGNDKSAILKTILTAPLRPEKYPVQLICPEQGDVSWYVDYQAASRLPDSFLNFER